MVILASLLVAAQFGNPLLFARDEIERVAPGQLSKIQLKVVPSKQKEAYSIVSKNGEVIITGSDKVGAMYGAFEFAERVRQHPESAWKTNASGKPFLADRGLNLFLTLPWNYAKNDTDYEMAALTDPNRWWFHNEDYWKTLLDLMAHSRLNWLDIHGAWDISVTNAPNLYAYFVTSPSFPKVGVPQDVKDKDLRQLNHIIDLAHERGIRVSLMAYEANLKIPQNLNPGYNASEANIYKYTKEVVEQMIRRAPGLDAIGYRIGESGRGESFFKCYGEAVKASGREIPIITRSWITRKQKVLPLARASKDFTVEIKYNGEQWGAPYPVVGGRMANWQSYSYEDYLSDSGSEKSEKMWPGWDTADGKQWPAQPYKVVWQVRANGTHRIFPFYNPNWVRRSINEMRMGTASGYTIEGLDAYYPKSPDYYLRDPKSKYCDWIHQRDEMYWMTWGRLGYDPKTPDATFDKRATELIGKGSEKLVEAWKESSLIIPKAFMAYSLGPDHRNHAPELEWGGDTNAFMQTGGFDSHSFASISEVFANRETGGVDSRADTFYNRSYNEDVLAKILEFQSNLRAQEIVAAIRMEQNLGEYYDARRMSAFFISESDPSRLENVSGFMNYAVKAHQLIADNSYYRPFTERLRMRTNSFSWKDEHQKLVAEQARILLLYPPKPAQKKAADSTNTNGGTTLSGGEGLVPDTIEMIPWIPEDGKLTWKAEGNTVICTLYNVDNANKVFLNVKPLPSTTFFHRIPMKKVGKLFQASFHREKHGHDISAEAFIGRFGLKIPAADKETPYLVIPAQPGPTPQFYSAEEAMTFLKPTVITPDKYGAILIGTRSANFFGFFNRATKRKLLEPVERGMKLVILQQDFNKNKLDWLPIPPKFEAANESTFEPAGALGLVNAKAPGIMWQRIAKTDGWDVFGNGGIARYKLGKGEIWVTSARLMQTMHLKDSAIDFVKLLSVGGKSKPTVLVDSGSEGGEFTSSNHPDLMNSHDIPFLTLGEVIAKEQKMDSFTPVPGPVSSDDVLNGNGPSIASKFVRDQVVKMSKVPTPQNLAAFEKVRVERKKELLRSLGLDPMPAKTPLNARITGTIQRNGYRIEKVVFESRPQFFVTCHVYVPDEANGKLPVIVNVNGHWAHKKGEDRIQLRAAFQATQGYIAIAVDSPGWSFEGNSLIERRDEGNHNDFKLVQGGSNTTGYYVWDTIRALDYMSTRADADMSRIGITGASGGGLATLYTFAADDRYMAAVPVVYMASMETAPDNGCLCNHVPATSQIGDRSDVMAIQAPKPVYLMGAQNDGEFPPDATRLTHRKMQETWALFGKKDDVLVQIFGGGHDYNQLMREASIGFFNKFVKGVGDGSPVKQPVLEAINPEDRQLLVLDPPLKERTMRDISREYLAKAPNKDETVEEIFKLNGGVPAKSDLKVKQSGKDWPRSITFESEPGLVTPGILIQGTSTANQITIYVSDDGKSAEIARHKDHLGLELYLDILGTGELSEFDLRFPVYAGRSVAFTGGWQIVRAVEALRGHMGPVKVVGRGPMSSQAVMFAALMEPKIVATTGIDCLRSWDDVFRDGVPDIAVQPRAHLLGTLENIRAKVKNAIWQYMK